MQLSKTFQFYHVYIEQKEELKDPDKTNKQTKKQTPQMLTSPHVSFPSLPCVLCSVIS